MKVLRKNLIFVTLILLTIALSPTPTRAEKSPGVLGAYVTGTNLKLNPVYDGLYQDHHSWNQPTVGVSGGCYFNSRIPLTGTWNNDINTIRHGASEYPSTGLRSHNGWTFVYNDEPYTMTYTRHGWLAGAPTDGGYTLIWKYQMTNDTAANPYGGTYIDVMTASVKLIGSGGSSSFAVSDLQWNPMVGWRGPAVEVTPYSPKVDGNVPTQVSITGGNSLARIPGTLSEKTYFLHEVIPNSPDVKVNGGYTNNLLSYQLGTTAPSLINSYAIQQRDVSGVVGLHTSNVWDRIGSGTIEWSVIDYQSDSTIFTEGVIIKTEGAPDINIFFAGGTTTYDYRWMSTDLGADTDRLGGLDVQASSTIDGNYDLSTFIGENKEQTDEVTRTSTDTNPVTNDVISGWSIPDSTTAGIPATSQAFLINDPTSLSEMSAAKRMYFDSTKPTITEVTTTDNWATIATDAEDEASGIGGVGTYDTGDVFFKFVAKGEEPTTPVGNDNGWTSIASYETTFASLDSGEYDLYVYAKDNATNRSNAIKANDDPIIVTKSATIIIKKTVVGTKGDADDVFLINLNDNTTNALITSVALKDGGTSSTLTIDMGSATSKAIRLSEIIPMDYKSGFTYGLTKKAGDGATMSGRTITIFPGDDITIEVRNTFAPTGYFKAKDFVKNLFK